MISKDYEFQKLFYQSLKNYAINTLSLKTLSFKDLAESNTVMSENMLKQINAAGFSSDVGNFLNKYANITANPNSKLSLISDGIQMSSAIGAAIISEGGPEALFAAF
jgi:hypothetical protein